MTVDDGASSSPFASYFENLVNDQEARKTSLEQRGTAVITTSGAVATLLFGLVTLIGQAPDFTLPFQARGPIGVALVALVCACTLAILTNVPAPYVGLSIKKPSEELRKLWAKKPDDALILITATRMAGLKRAKLINDLKAWVLVVAVSCQVVGVVGITLAVREVLVNG